MRANRFTIAKQESTTKDKMREMKILPLGVSCAGPGKNQAKQHRSDLASMGGAELRLSSSQTAAASSLSYSHGSLTAEAPEGTPAETPEITQQ